MVECPSCDNTYSSLGGMSRHHAIKHPEEFEELFWSLADVGDESDCWEWQGAYSGDGYGLIQREGKKYKTHRLAYRFEHGQLKKPQVNHHCDNGMCVNPNHLYNGTQSDNMKDNYERNENVRAVLESSRETKMKRLQKIADEDLYARGEDNAHSKLTESDVVEIKNLVGDKTDVEIAERFGVSRQAINDIKLGRNWSHIWVATANIGGYR